MDLVVKLTGESAKRLAARRPPKFARYEVPDEARQLTEAAVGHLLWELRQNLAAEGVPAELVERAYHATGALVEQATVKIADVFASPLDE